MFKKPLTISQINFERKPLIHNHVIMTGDAAGLIYPLCGNGMAIAIHSAKMIATLLGEAYQNNKISRKEIEYTYTKTWKSTFSKRLMAGRVLQHVFTT